MLLVSLSLTVDQQNTGARLSCHYFFPYYRQLNISRVLNGGYYLFQVLTPQNCVFFPAAHSGIKAGFGISQKLERRARGNSAIGM